MKIDRMIAHSLIVALVFGLGSLTLAQEKEGYFLSVGLNHWIGLDMPDNIPVISSSGVGKYELDDSRTRPSFTFGTSFSDSWSIEAGFFQIPSRSSRASIISTRDSDLTPPDLVSDLPETFRTTIVMQRKTKAITGAAVFDAEISSRLSLFAKAGVAFVGQKDKNTLYLSRVEDPDEPSPYAPEYRTTDDENGIDFFFAVGVSIPITNTSTEVSITYELMETPAEIEGSLRAGLYWHF